MYFLATMKDFISNIIILRLDVTRKTLQRFLRQLLLLLEVQNSKKQHLRLMSGCRIEPQIGGFEKMKRPILLFLILGCISSHFSSRCWWTRTRPSRKTQRHKWRNANEKSVRVWEDVEPSNSNGHLHGWRLFKTNWTYHRCILQFVHWCVDLEWALVKQFRWALI